MGALLGLRYSFHCGCSAGRITDLLGTQLHFLKPRPPLCNCTEAKWNRNSSLRPQDICRGAATTLGCLFSALFQCEESESLLGLTVASEMCRLCSVALRMYVLRRMYVCAMGSHRAIISAPHLLELTVSWDKHRMRNHKLNYVTTTAMTGLLPPRKQNSQKKNDGQKKWSL